MKLGAAIHKALHRSVFTTYRKWAVKAVRAAFARGAGEAEIAGIIRRYSAFNPDVKTRFEVRTVRSASSLDNYTNVGRETLDVYTARPRFDATIHELELLKTIDLDLCLLRDVQVTGGSSLVVCSGSVAVYENFARERDDRYSFIGQGLMAQQGDTFCLSYRESGQLIDRGLFLAGNFSVNYFHLLYEIVSRIYYFEKFVAEEGIPYIVDAVVGRIPQFRELFDIFNLRNREVLLVEAGCRYRVDNLYYLQNVNFVPPHYHDFSRADYRDCHFDLRSLDFLRERLLAASSGRRFPKRLFLSRKNASRRRRCNEDELFPLLERHGFEEFFPEHHSIADQVAAFHGAEFIVGVSGAAFSNLVVCREGCRLLCIVPGRLDLSIFSTVARRHDLDLRYYPADSTRRGDVAHDDFHVDPGLFETRVADWINTGG